MRLVVCFLCICLPSLAATIHVPSDHPTIQAGIEAATAGDTVLVASGTYYENLVWPDIDGIALIGSGSETCVIDAGGVFPATAVTFDSDQIGSETLLSDVTLTNGRWDFGSGASLLSSSPRIENVVFYENNSIMYGGGMACLNANPSLKNVSFVNNTAYEGGGIIAYESNIDLLNVAFVGNQAATDQGGGAIRSEQSVLLCENLVLDNNGVHSIAAWRISLTVTNLSARRSPCHFYECDVTVIGGEVTDTQVTPFHCIEGLLQFEGVTISSNIVEEGCSGISADRAHVSLETVSFHSNYSGDSYSCVYMWGEDSQLTLSNCTLSLNESSSELPAVYCSDESSLTISNTILWGNGVIPPIESGQTESIECSDIEGGWSGTGNIDLNPLFCDPNANDFSLQSDSPCAPDNNDCGILMGAWPVGCSTSTREASWSSLKCLY